MSSPYTNTTRITAMARRRVIVRWRTVTSCRLNCHIVSIKEIRASFRGTADREDGGAPAAKSTN
jgi:hypothetical protein